MQWLGSWGLARISDFQFPISDSGEFNSAIGNWKLAIKNQQSQISNQKSAIKNQQFFTDRVYGASWGTEWFPSHAPTRRSTPRRVQCPYQNRRGVRCHTYVNLNTT